MYELIVLILLLAILYNISCSEKLTPIRPGASFVNNQGLQNALYYDK